MYRLLIATYLGSYPLSNGGGAVHSVVVEFRTQAEADAIANKINIPKPGSFEWQRATRLYITE